MKFFNAILFVLFALVLNAQNQQVKLPDVFKVDSVRIVKKTVTPGEPRKIQYISIEQGDTVRSALQDSAALANLVAQTINEENQKAANNTYLLYQSFTKSKGVDQYNKLFRRITGQNYRDFLWSLQKTPYLGQWQLSGIGIDSHVLTVTDDAKATRNTGTPKYTGKFAVLSVGSRVQLINYLKANETLTFDFVGRNQFTQNGQQITQEMFMSTNGQYFLLK